MVRTSNVLGSRKHFEFYGSMIMIMIRLYLTREGQRGSKRRQPVLDQMKDRIMGFVDARALPDHPYYCPEERCRKRVRNSLVNWTGNVPEVVVCHTRLSLFKKLSRDES